MKVAFHTETWAPFTFITFLPAACCSVLQAPMLAMPADKGSLHRFWGFQKRHWPLSCRFACMAARQMWQLIYLHLSSISQAIRHQARSTPQASAGQISPVANAFRKASHALHRPGGVSAQHGKSSGAHRLQIQIIRTKFQSVHPGKSSGAHRLETQILRKLDADQRHAVKLLHGNRQT